MKERKKKKNKTEKREREIKDLNNYALQKEGRTDRQTKTLIE